MTAAELLGDLARVNLAAGAAILGVIALRKAARARFGARLAYGLWLLPALAGAAVLIPARQVVVVRTAAAPVAAARAHATFAAIPSVAATHLDPSLLLIGVWLVGVMGVALVMALLQLRFVSDARAGAVSPAVVGVIAPRIVTPRDFAQRYSADEQALVLAHEQAHIARQDSRLNGLSAAAQCLCWFNPLVHLAARMMRIDQELACDEAVVTRFPAARRAYAEVLMKAQLATAPLPLGCYWPPKAQHPLVERVAMLKSKTIGRSRRLTGAAVLAMLCAGAGVAAWAAQPADVRVTAKPVQDAPAATPMTIKAATVDVLGPPTSGQSASNVAAIIGGDIISTYDRDQRVKLLAAQRGVALTPENLPQLQRDALRSLDDERRAGAISVEADAALGDPDEGSTRYAGNVDFRFGGVRMLSDTLVIDMADKVTVSARSAPSQGALDQVDSLSYGVRRMTAQGHVFFTSPGKKANADQAVYDRASNTITFSGNATIVRGETVAKGDKLVLDLKAD